MFADEFGAANVTVSSYGNFCAAANFLDGRAAEELRATDLDHFDPDYEVLIFVRAVKH
jgi:hypothetical protein